jgi:hypothetical protein
MGKNDGGQASSAVSLRDYFAAAAVQGLAVSWGQGNDVTVDDLAEDAYRVADAMIAAREAKP